MELGFAIEVWVNGEAAIWGRSCEGRAIWAAMRAARMAWGVRMGAVVRLACDAVWMRSADTAAPS